MDDGGGVILAFAESAGDELAADVAGEDAGHAVVAEAFSRLVADDVFDLARAAARLRVVGVHAAAFLFRRFRANALEERLDGARSAEEFFDGNVDVARVADG